MYSWSPISCLVSATSRGTFFLALSRGMIVLKGHIWSKLKRDKIGSSLHARLFEREHDRHILIKNEYLVEEVSKRFSVVDKVHHGDTDFKAKTSQELRNKIVVCWEGLLCNNGCNCFQICWKPQCLLRMSPGLMSPGMWTK